MATYQITLNGPDGERSFPCEEDTPILEAAKSAGIELPFGCRGGVCGACVHRIVSGNVDQGSQMALDDDSVAEGLTVLCIGRPLSDVVLAPPEG